MIRHAILAQTVGYPSRLSLGVDVSVLADVWYSKTGIHASDDAAVEERAKRVRSCLTEISRELENKEKRDIIVVTHGVFMRILSGDQTTDLPKRVDILLC